MEDDIANRIKESGAKGRESWSAGKLDLAEKHFLEAWAVLPEPKESNDWSQTVSRGLVSFYQKTSQFEKADKWLKIVRKMYRSSEASDTMIDYMTATVYFDWGKKDEAFALFDSLYKKHKRRPFQGDDRKYLDFYLSRAKIK
jgi:tetratricopeptide (TPR) repeat protein